MSTDTFVAERPAYLPGAAIAIQREKGRESEPVVVAGHKHAHPRHLWLLEAYVNLRLESGMGQAMATAALQDLYRHLAVESALLQAATELVDLMREHYAQRERDAKPRNGRLR